MSTTSVHYDPSITPEDEDLIKSKKWDWPRVTHCTTLKWSAKEETPGYRRLVLSSAFEGSVFLDISVSDFKCRDAGDFNYLPLSDTKAPPRRK